MPLGGRGLGAAPLGGKRVTRIITPPDAGYIHWLQIRRSESSLARRSFTEGLSARAFTEEMGRKSEAQCASRSFTYSLPHRGQ